VATASAMALPAVRAAAHLAAPTSARAVVAVAHRLGLVGPNRSLAPQKLADAVAAAVARAAGERTATDALRKLFRPSDKVGIKVNCLGGPGLSSRPELALQVAQLLQTAGVPASQIVIWDRSEHEMRRVGYLPSRGQGVAVLGIDQDYEDGVQEWGPAASRFARVLVEELTALINLPVLKDHGLAGVSASLKNWYGTVHNPNKLHGDGCNPYIPHLAAAPVIRGKFRLTVVDATTAQCHGGPSYSPQWAWPHEAVLASTDQVALDAIAWRIVEGRRKEVGRGTLASEGREPRYIAEAAKLGLGVADPARIEVAQV
jgi:uncharacterized protein (DUF362 family)